MVREVLERKYYCPYCGDEFDDYDSARSCAVDCHMEDLEEIDIGYNYFVCEYCESEFLDCLFAKNCEEKHIRFNDKYYKNFIDRKRKRKIIESR